MADSANNPTADEVRSFIAAGLACELVEVEQRYALLRQSIQRRLITPDRIRLSVSMIRVTQALGGAGDVSVGYSEKWYQ